MELNVILTARRDLHEALAIFRLAFRDGSTLAFRAGQFVRVGVPLPPSAPEARSPLLLRAYSIASAEGEREIELFLRRVASGRLTPELFALHAGDPLFVEPRARGHFTLAGLPADADHAWIATGTGIAPYVSMLRTHARDERRPWRRLAIVHGARVAADLGYADEIAGLARALPEVSYHPLLSREPETSGWAGLRGRVQELLEPSRWRERVPFALDPGAARVLLCGNPEMIGQVTDLLETLGFRRSRRGQQGTLRTERYW